MVDLPVIGNELALEIEDELARAMKHGVQFSTAHEAYGVLLEEVDEFWDLVKLKKKERDPTRLKEELIQIAAMAIKGIQSVEHFTGGKV